MIVSSTRELRDMNGPAPFEVGPVWAVVAFLVVVALAFIAGALVRGREW